MLKWDLIQLLHFCQEPRTLTEIWQFSREQFGIYRRTPKDVAVSLFKKRYVSWLVKQKLIFEYSKNDLFFEKIRQYLVIKRRAEKRAVPRKLLNIYQTNLIYPITLYFHYSDVPQRLREINFDLSILFRKIFAQKGYVYGFMEILNLIICYAQDKDKVRLLIYNNLEENKAEIVDKFLLLCKKIPKDLSLPFNGNYERAEKLLENLA